MAKNTTKTETDETALGGADMTPVPPNTPDAYLTEQEKDPTPPPATEPAWPERALTVEEQGIYPRTPYPTGDGPEQKPVMSLLPTLKGVPPEGAQAEPVLKRQRDDPAHRRP